MEDIIIIGVIVILVIVGIFSGKKHFKGEGGCCGGGSTPIPKQKKKLGKVVAQKTVLIEGMTCTFSVFHLRQATLRYLRQYEKNQAIASHTRFAMT